MILRFANLLKRDRRGVAAVEFAIVLPFLVLLLFGIVEGVRFVLVAQTLTNVGRTMADLVSQGETLSSAELNSLYAAVEHVAGSIDVNASGVVIISSISVEDGNPPRINWQRARGDLSTVTSAIGTPGSNLSLPTGFSVTPGYTLITAEVYYDFEPLFFAWIIPPTRLYRVSYFRARRGSLASLGS